MVVSAVRTVSPESCTTMFSTPCVLGCCGPMLTVITSLRSSGIGAFNDLTHDMHQRAMHFLHARGVLVGHVHVDVGGAAHAAAVTPGEGDRLQAPRLRRLQRRE